jgi:hypothetical protein
MSLELHEWDIHIVCRGADDVYALRGAGDAYAAVLVMGMQPRARRPGSSPGAHLSPPGCEYRD